MTNPLAIVNLDEARYECTFGRGCDGVCCREGRPIVYPEEVERLDANLSRILPRLRPEAQALVRRSGYLRARRRLGHPVMRVAAGWCVFFNQGCVLHQVGAEEGDKFRYKPAVCSLFPIQQNPHDRWYIRQKGVQGEKWDLFCLDPQATNVRAADSLVDEIALAARFEDEARAAEKAAQTPVPLGSQ